MKALVVPVVALVVALIVGIAVGLLIQATRNAPQIKFANKMTQVVKALSSKTVVSIVMYGQVTSIDGRNLTINFNGESYTLGIKKDAVVYAFSSKSGSTASVQQAVKFEDIKQGQNISVNLKLLPDGQLEGQTVFILPVTEVK